MTRFAAAALETAAEQPHVPYVIFADLDFVSGHLRLNSSDRALEFGGNVYLGGGELVGMGEVVESAALNPEKISLTLSGVDNALIAKVLTESYHGRSATLYMSYIGADGALVSTPEMLWEGRMDSMGIEVSRGSSVIELICESRLLLWNESVNLLYTDEHQALLTDQSLVATLGPDSFFNRVVELADKVVRWGGKTVPTFTGRGQTNLGTRKFG